MTREGNDNPSFDDRSARANAQHGAAFVTLHIASTGVAGTARVYVVPDIPPSNDATGTDSLGPRARTVRRLQPPTRRLGPGRNWQSDSGVRPISAQVAPVRQLRTTAAPAIAVEISSVTVPERADLDRMVPGVAEAIAQGIVAFKPFLCPAGAAGNAGRLSSHEPTIARLAGGRPVRCSLCCCALFSGSAPASRARPRKSPRKPRSRRAANCLPVTPAASSEPKVKVKMFWGSGNDDGMLKPVTVELPLSNDPVLRAKEVLNTLLAGPVDPEARTLPPDAALLAFYILPDGTAIADFSEALGTSIPSGIQSEQLAIDSIARTLEANVPQVQRIKILIHGQEVETLAGHIDLTQTFRVNTKVPGAPAAPTPSAVSAITAPIQKAVEKVEKAVKR